jgi:mannitol-1-phosphate 5-dehydrogenase
MCENLIDADKVMRDGVGSMINRPDLFDEKIGFVQASVSRTVPVQTDKMKGGDPLRIVSENYKYLYVDRDGFRGEVPEIKNIIAYSPFKYYIERKLYVHNMGHALCAYLGDIKGYEYIWQAIEDPYIKEAAEKAMKYSAEALEKIYDEFDHDYIGDLIHRFANKALGDTVARVGADLKRKLAVSDRIVGALRLMITHDLPVDYICLTIAAAVNFKHDKLSGRGLEEILKEAGSYDYIAGNTDVFSRIKKLFEEMKQ